MKRPVVIKENSFGLLVILDNEIPFEKLLLAVAEKFKSSANFFGNGEMAIEFGGRELTEEEEEIILDTIHKNVSFTVVCTIDRDKSREENFKRHLEEIIKREDLSLAKIHIGNFRSGNMMKFDTGVILIGDINPGAKIISTGNIIVLGSLKGEAEAGYGGRDEAFIIALDMNPIQLRIGSKIARSSDNSSFSKREIKTLPQIAFVENNNIYIGDLDKNVQKFINI